jgi:hypothetical protein
VPRRQSGHGPHRIRNPGDRREEGCGGRTFYDNESRKAAAWAALLGVAAGLLGGLLALFTNDDDLVHERAIGFDRGYVRKLHWSIWRRRRQHQARTSHYKRRGYSA